MYSITTFPSCCGSKIIHDVSDINAGSIKAFNRYGNDRPWPEYTLYAILNVKSQAKELKLFYKYGWKNSGRKWIAKSGNTLQTIVRYPIKKK